MVLHVLYNNFSLFVFNKLYFQDSLEKGSIWNYSRSLNGDPVVFEEGHFRRKWAVLGAGVGPGRVVEPPGNQARVNKVVQQLRSLASRKFRLQNKLLVVQAGVSGKEYVIHHLSISFIRLLIWIKSQTWF